ncbi:MAG: DUF6788 family protein [Acidimicrobiales bacterium]
MGKRGAAVPTMVRGSVITHRRRCGKANCRCADGARLHQSIVLSYSEGGRTKFLMLPEPEVLAVAEAVERYRTAKSRVEDEGNAGLVELVARLGHKR